jgi:ADP-ribosylglycohydrolase
MTHTLSSDPVARFQRALQALEGLSVGDALGNWLFHPSDYRAYYRTGRLPPAPWWYTDDTEMALGIVEVLHHCGRVDPDALAAVFARRYVRRPHRGYGAMAHAILTSIAQGVGWQDAARAAFGGQGSLGNGAAMRVAPLGAYFADDLDRVIAEARQSAVVTHTHWEGIAGGIAVAVAGALAVQARGQAGRGSRGQLLRGVLEQTPPGETHDRLACALELSPETTVQQAADRLGNGSRITAPDTVPLAVWVADRYLDDYPEAVWTVISAGGDVDTNAAIVGGIVASAVPEQVPAEWITHREALDGGSPSWA